MTDTLPAVVTDIRMLPSFYKKTILQEEILGEALPNLIKGKINVEEFAGLEDESVARFLKEQ